MNKLKIFISLKLLLFIFSVVIFLITMFISSYLFHEHSKDMIDEEVRNKLLNITKVSSFQFNSSDLDKLNVIKDAEKIEYKNTKDKLIKIINEVERVKSVSIVKKINDSTAKFLIDASTKPQDINEDGEIFPETEGLILLEDPSTETKISSEQGLETAFKTPTIVKMIHKDKIGSWLTAYAPIGNNYALEMEVYIDKSKELKKFLDVLIKSCLLSLFAVIVFMFTSSIVLIMPIKKLTSIVKSIRSGDFSSKVNFSIIYGEMWQLGEAINYLSDELKKYYEKSEESKILLEEKKKIIETTNKKLQSKNYELNNTILTLNKINELVEQLISIKETQELMDTVLTSTIDIINAEKGFILEKTDNDNFLVMTSYRTTTIVDKNEFVFSDIKCLKTLFDTKNYLNTHEKGVFSQEEYDNALIFPFIIEDEIKGLMFIINKIQNDDSEKIYFDESDEATVRTLSKLVSAVWESIHLFELATIDSESKMYVRRYFEKNLEEEIKKSNKNDSDLSLIMIDIDNLQKYNNKYGRLEGDKIIEQFSERIKELVDENYLTARYGGDKFTVLMPEKKTEEAYELGEVIRSEIESKDFSIGDNKNEKVTISVGISSFPENGDTIEKLLRNTESALYKAKQEGKNKVVKL